MADDVRWQQRFANYINVFTRLEQAVEAYGDTTLDIIKEGQRELDNEALREHIERVGQRFDATHSPYHPR
nr:hypothetical protein BN993_02293 [Virgibacillus halodenitrificans]